MVEVMMVVSVRREVDAEVRGRGGASVCGEEMVPTEQSGAHGRRACCSSTRTNVLLGQYESSSMTREYALPGECADSKQRPVLLRVPLRPLVWVRMAHTPTTYVHRDRPC